MKVVPPFLRTPFNYDRDAASNETAIDCSDDPGETKQSFREECDINTIVRRFGLSGELPVGVRSPTYGDFSTVVDFQSAMNAIAQAHEAFDAMPAEVRSRFQNDPGQFVDFVAVEANRGEAEKLGLVLPKVLPPKATVESVAAVVAALDKEP